MSKLANEELVDRALIAMSFHGLVISDKDYDAFTAGVRHTQSYKEVKNALLHRLISEIEKAKVEAQIEIIKRLLDSYDMLSEVDYLEEYLSELQEEQK